VLKGLSGIYTILNSECCKCARTRFHCAYGLVVLVNFVVAPLKVTLFASNHHSPILITKGFDQNHSFSHILLDVCSTTANHMKAQAKDSRRTTSKIYIDAILLQLFLIKLTKLILTHRKMHVIFDTFSVIDKLLCRVSVHRRIQGT